MVALRKSNRTISLIVLIGLVAIVAIIAIPNLRLAGMTANEAAARRSLRAINLAQTKFAGSNPKKGFSCGLRTLGDARLISDRLASGAHKGYVFEISNCESELPNSELPNKEYRVSAHPAQNNKTGYWVFCSDQTATVKGSPQSLEDCFDQGVAQR
jgi:type II secretory pathway pseudopilin PulG